MPARQPQTRRGLRFGHFEGAARRGMGCLRARCKRPHPRDGRDGGRLLSPLVFVALDRLKADSIREVAMDNPFQVGNMVETGEFVNRRRELRRVTGGIVNGGQSSAVIGEPRTGKTSLLRYLMTPETQAALYGEVGVEIALPVPGRPDAGKRLRPWEILGTGAAAAGRAGPGREQLAGCLRDLPAGEFWHLRAGAAVHSG